MAKANAEEQNECTGSEALNGEITAVTSAGDLRYRCRQVMLGGRPRPLKPRHSMTFKFSELCEPAEGRSTHPGRSLGLQDLRCR